MEDGMKICMLRCKPCSTTIYIPLCDCFGGAGLLLILWQLFLDLSESVIYVFRFFASGRPLSCLSLLIFPI